MRRHRTSKGRSRVGKSTRATLVVDVAAAAAATCTAKGTKGGGRCSGGSSTCWVPNAGTDGPLAVRAGTGGQLAPMTGTGGLGMGGRLICSTGVACSLMASVGAGVGCSADGVVGGKGACCCLPDARGAPRECTSRAARA